jgi:hypothetical protein
VQHESTASLIQWYVFIQEQFIQMEEQYFWASNTMLESFSNPSHKEQMKEQHFWASNTLVDTIVTNHSSCCSSNTLEFLGN